MRRCVFALLVGVAICVAAACGETESQSSAPSGGGDESQQQSGSRYTEDSVEYQLAVIDEGYVSTDDPVINQYRALLDRLKPRCKEGRRLIADQAVKTQQLLRERIGVDEPVIVQLKALRAATEGLPRQPCADVFVAYVILRIGRGSELTPSSPRTERRERPSVRVASDAGEYGRLVTHSSIPLGEWSGSDATRELRKTIVEFNEQSARQTQTMIRLTKAIVVLTFVLVLGLAVQIWLEVT